MKKWLCLKRLNTCLKIWLFLLIIIFNGCSPKKAPAFIQVNKNPVKFDYSTNTIAETGSAEVTIALLNPEYGNSNMDGSLFDTYRKSMGNDFEELLTSKGFKIRGPYNQIGEMLYNDKLNSDMIVKVVIDLNFSNLERKVKRNEKAPSFAELMVDSKAQSTVWYTYFGKGSFTTTLTITASSSNFNEKLWKKNITLPEAPLTYTGSIKWRDRDVSFLGEITKDNEVYNIFTKSLMEQYNSIFDLLEKQINAEEFQGIKKEAHKVDKKE